MSPFSEGTRSYGGPVTRRDQRVLLFVQTGSEQWKCLGTVRQPLHAWRCWATYRQIDKTDAADRWKLVRCDNAACGRLIIECSLGLCDSPEGCVCKSYGRVIASGGRT